MLEVQNLTVRFGSLTIVDNISFSLAPGQWLMVVGPNGAGKTTIISAISRAVPYTGQVLFEGRDIRHQKTRELAQCMGVLSQNHYVGYGFTVEEVIRLGRYAHAPGLLGGKQHAGEALVAQAIAKTGMEPYLKQSVLTLSGGELQRTFLAQLFAQDPRLLILDEPTNHLDLVYQKQVFQLVQEWLRQPGRAVISVVHDLSLARAYGTHAILMQKGRIVSAGATQEVMTPDNLNAVYAMDVFDWMQRLYGQWAPGEGEGTL